MKFLFLVFLFHSINLSANNLQYDTVTLQNYSVNVNNTNNLNNFFADSPDSVNVFVLEDIEEHGIDSIQDVTAEIPNFNFSNAGSRSFHSILGVRGLANTPFFSDPSVVLYIDDVPYGHTFSYSNQIYGVEKIEAYRGPQGASFGKNNYGGVLNVRSRKPGNQLKTHISGSYSRFNSWMTNAYIDGAIIPDKLFLSLGGAFSHSDGYLYNDFLNNTPDQENHLSGRAALAWQPNADWKISLMANGDDFKDATPHLISTHSKDSLTISSDQNGKLEQNANTLALRMQYEHKGLEFLSVTSHRDWQLKPFFMDIDLTPIPLLTTTINKRQAQWNQEFRLSSKYTDFAWSIGSFVSIGKNDSNGFTQVFGRPVIVYGGTTEDENYAVFTNLTYAVTDDFRIHTGLRLDYIYKEIDRTINTAPRLKKDRDFLHFSPKLSVDYLLNDDVLVFSSTALAFKPGGYSMVANNPTQAEFDSETLWANEFGFKAHWLENHLQTHLTFFYYRIDHYQVERLATPVDFTIVNAPKTTSYGLELETAIEIIPGLQLETAFGYTHIRFDTFQDPITKKDLSGHSPPYVPEKTFTVAGQYKLPSGYFVRSEWLWNDKIHFDDFNSTALTEADYSILNARLGYQGKYLSLYLIGENLTDTRYHTFILPFNAASPGKPRSFGIRVDLDY